MAVMTTFNNSRPFDVSALVQIGTLHISAPSNIALIKYWGKRANQLPCNPSLSMTLEKSRTYLSLEYRGRSYLKDQLIHLNYQFEGHENLAFAQKITKFLEKLTAKECPYLAYFDLSLSSHNTFPHSAGIASSASSMAALACALVTLEGQIFNQQYSDEQMKQRMSHLARLGSGSASRSVEGAFCQWGVDGLEVGNDEYAMVINKIHPLFLSMRDSILILDDQAKAVSSSQGHALMENHPYAEARFKRASERVTELKQVLESGQWDEFARLVESEALELHGLMMSSTPAYILMRPQTLEAIERIKRFQVQESVKITYTLDAGANLHVLYPEVEESKVLNFLQQSCVPLCVEGRMIHDQAGLGFRFETGL